MCVCDTHTHTPRYIGVCYFFLCDRVVFWTLFLGMGKEMGLGQFFEIFLGFAEDFGWRNTLTSV